ncbi:MAG: FAD-dependent oxidoreductase [Bacillota bacterium]
MAQWLESLSDNILIDKSKCISCQECVNKCILDNLRFKASPCRESCPLRLNCQGYIQLVARGEEKKALEIIYKSIPFAGILGHICYAPCEDSCSRREFDGESVAIRNIKRYIVDQVIKSDEEFTESWKNDYSQNWLPEQELTQQVAIIGGGPAGITAACFLRKQGYQVDVFEASSEIGGMLSICIPEFRLPSNIVKRELGLVYDLGINVQLNKDIDSNSLSEITDKYDAVLIATGASKIKTLSIPNAQISGIINGIEFLKKVSSGENLDKISGKRLAIIGGGNVALDAARTAIRLGAKECNLVYRRTENEMPAYKEEIDNAKAEGVNFIYLAEPKEFIGNEQGEIAKVIFQKNKLGELDISGRPSIMKVPNSEFTINLDMVILAIGQETNLDIFRDEDIEQFKVNKETLQSSIEKIFVAGDFINGPMSVVKAMGDGKNVSETIVRFLRNEPLEFGRKDSLVANVETEVNYSDAILQPRINPEREELTEISSFNLVERTYSQTSARTEASRCLSCGEPFGKHRTCWSCLPCEVECPEEALRVTIPYLMK